MLNRNTQTTLDLGAYAELYGILIEPNNFWRQLNESVDFSFIHMEKCTFVRPVIWQSRKENPRVSVIKTELIRV